MCSFQHLALSIMVLFPRGSAPCSYMDTVVKDLSKLGKRSNYWQKVFALLFSDTQWYQHIMLIMEQRLLYRFDLLGSKNILSKNQFKCMRCRISCIYIVLTHLPANYTLNGKEAKVLTGDQVVSSGDLRKWVGTSIWIDMPWSSFLPLKKLKLMDKKYSFYLDRRLTIIKVSETKNRKCWVSPFKSYHNTEKFYSGFNMTREENSVQIISKG